MSIYIVSGVCLKLLDKSTFNIQHVLNFFHASSKEEAIGKAVTKWALDLPDYSLFSKPLVSVVPEQQPEKGETND